jgi:hypothetical protein
MSTIAVQMPKPQTLLRLGRVSNLPTVWTNVMAGVAITSAAAPVATVVAVGLAMTAFYVGGMYLNDYFDREIDARERPGRPIHAGEIGARTVSAIGFGLLATGLALLAPFGLAAVTWGLALAGAIVLYDAWHKGNALGPWIMSTCRALVYLASGSAAAGGISWDLMICAVALAAHVAGLTYAAKQENLNQIGSLWPLAILSLPLLLGLPALPAGGLVIVCFALLGGVDVIAVRALALRTRPDTVPRAVSMLIAGICLVDALAIAAHGGNAVLAFGCAAGYLLTRLFQAVIPGT